MACAREPRRRAPGHAGARGRGRGRGRVRPRCVTFLASEASPLRAPPARWTPPFARRTFLPAERAALLQAKATWSLDVNVGALANWISSTCPCHPGSAWNGVSCRDGRVHSLDLTGLGDLADGPPQCLSALETLAGL